MPVRFQVDGDFYDHPKTIGMSPEAYKLWTRAGSYSANKLTDGLITDDVLVDVLREPRTAADELVRRRLWRRVRGGFQFHSWGDRNLLKDQVEATRKADRERKANKRRDEEPQAEGNSVRPESGRSPGGIRAESVKNPAASVSVLGSESVLGSGRGSPIADQSMPELGPEPPPRCPRHVDQATEEPCWACKAAREIHQAWQRERVSRDALTRSAVAKDRAIARQAEIDACTMCDETGYRKGRLCHHRTARRPA